MENIVDSTLDYEDYVRQNIQLLNDDLTLKHIRMRENKFSFFRGTYYRWAELFPALLPKLMDAPKITAIGDLHVENFGTFRDSDGELEWGINDFDEVEVLPYLNDIVRLTASALIAISENRLTLKPKKACEAILKGYIHRIKEGRNKPFVLKKQREPFLSKLTKHSFDNTESFWRHVRNSPYVSSATLPKAAVELLRNAIGRSNYFVLHRRVAGMGSLGHLKFVAIYCDMNGSKDDTYGAFELKELGPSATFWLNKTSWKKEKLLNTVQMMNDSSRRIKDTWLIRRIGPDSVKLELSMLPAKKKESTLLYFMGSETANLHLKVGSQPEVIVDDLKHRDDEWLYGVSKRMVDKLTEDWEVFKEKFKL